MLTFIFSILASLLATGVGAAGVWFYNRKKRIDASENQIDRIMNDISTVKDRMANGFERITLEKETILSAFDSTKKEMEQANKDAILRQKDFYQLIIDRLQAETQKHEDLRVRVDQNIIETQKQMAKNTELVKSASDMITQLDDNFRRSQNLPPL